MLQLIPESHLASLHRARIVGTAERLSVAFRNRIVERYHSRDGTSDGDEQREGDEDQTEGATEPPFGASFGRWSGTTCFPDPHCGWDCPTKSVIEYASVRGKTYTASGVPQRALINVRRSSKTGMASENRKTRIPVPKMQDLLD